MCWATVEIPRHFDHKTVSFCLVIFVKLVRSKTLHLRVCWCLTHPQWKCQNHHWPLKTMCSSKLVRCWVSFATTRTRLHPHATTRTGVWRERISRGGPWRQWRESVGPRSGRAGAGGVTKDLNKAGEWHTWCTHIYYILPGFFFFFFFLLSWSLSWSRILYYYTRYSTMAMVARFFFELHETKRSSAATIIILIYLIIQYII